MSDNQTILAISDLILTAVVTLAAAFFGARYAFNLERERSEDAETSKNIASANQALFILIRYHNLFLNLKKQIVGEFESHPHRHHFIKPMMAATWDPPNFKFDNLAFLIDVEPELLFKLSLCEQDIAGTLDLIKERSKIHYDFLQPAVERIQAHMSGDRISVDAVEAELGQRTTAILRASTDFMIQGINRAISSTKANAADMRLAVQTVYPKSRLLAMQTDPVPAGET